VRQDLLENLTLHSHVQIAEVLEMEQGTEDLLVPNASLEECNVVKPEPQLFALTE
jgi:hypothetical protein